MTIGLRTVLLVIALLSCIFVVRKIRKAQMRIEDTLFWIVVVAGTLVLGVFPQIAFWCADILGIASPVNFVFLVFIFILLFKVFILTVQISQLQEKIKNLTQSIAITNYETNKKEKEKNDGVKCISSAR